MIDLLLQYGGLFIVSLLQYGGRDVSEHTLIRIYIFVDLFRIQLILHHDIYTL